jgi:hypothetical protein
MTLINGCPNCTGYVNQNLLFVEVTCENFQHAIAVECQICGMRGMAADLLDPNHEEIAIKLWNNIAIPETSHEKEPKIWEIALDVRKAQKEFYKKRKKVGKTEHDSLLQDALAKESLLDKVLVDHFNPDREEQGILL